MIYAQRKQVAIEAVLQAAALCTAVRAEMVEVESINKEDRSPVTIADFGAQALVCRQLKAAFPDDVIVAEEDAAVLRLPENATTLAQVTTYVQRFQPQATAEMICQWIDAGKGQVWSRYWTLDPIDGTKGFLRNDQYAIALALIEGGQVQVSVLACPALPMDMNQPLGENGVLFVASRGEGAVMERLNFNKTNNLFVLSDRTSEFPTYLPPFDGLKGEVIRVANGTEAQQAKMRFVESVEAGHGDHALQQAIAQAVGISQPSLRMDSQAKYGAVARGDAVLYLRLPSPKSPDYREKIWDHAAGVLLVEEAGGRVTDMYGQPLDFASGRKMENNRGVVVSNGLIHATVIEALHNRF